MTQPEGPYTAVFAVQVESQAAALPKQARLALADALEEIVTDPWAHPRYHPKMPAEIRTATYGDAGFLSYVIHPRRSLVIVAHLTWIA